jgi:hypothetical protein
MLRNSRMIYSKWLPDRGGYAYHETSERRGLADDLPVPQLTTTTILGAASTEIGRAIPLGGKIVGYGPLPRGSIAPLDRSGLSGIMSPGSFILVLLVAVGAVSAVAGAFAVKKFLR